MSGLWLASYICMWVVVVILCFLMVGLLQQLGFIRHLLDEKASSQLDESPGQPGVLPPLNEDGPDIGSDVPEPTLETFNHNRAPLTPASWHHQRGTLVMFMSAVCESCQHLVDSLNQLVDNRVFEGQVIVILRADKGLGQGFLSIFPLHVPVVLDQDNKVSMSFDVHRMPMALLYNGQGKLIRKGTPITHEGLLVLIGDPTISPESIPEEELARVYPPLLLEQRVANEDKLAQPQLKKEVNL